MSAWPGLLNRNMKIHPTAIIGDGAQIAGDVEIGAYAVIEGGVRIAEGSKIEAHARLCRGAVIGKNCSIGSFTIIAGIPQDLHFDASIESFTEIGDGTIVREGATIHRATRPGGSTVVGRNCFIMATTHIGHDVQIAENCIQGCFSAIAGFSVIERDVFISGGVLIHQKIRVGQGCMLSGNSAFSLDVPPFVNGLLRNTVSGLNILGMKRRGFSADEINDAKAMYHLTYATNSAKKNAMEALKSGAAKTCAGKIFLEFFAAEGRHYATPRNR